MVNDCYCYYRIVAASFMLENRRIDYYGVLMKFEIFVLNSIVSEKLTINIQFIPNYPCHLLLPFSYAVESFSFHVNFFEGTALKTHSNILY